jgi:hypothetical protein
MQVGRPHYTGFWDSWHLPIYGRRLEMTKSVGVDGGFLCAGGEVEKCLSRFRYSLHGWSNQTNDIGVDYIISADNIGCPPNM